MAFDDWNPNATAAPASSGGFDSWNPNAPAPVQQPAQPPKQGGILGLVDGMSNYLKPADMQSAVGNGNASGASVAGTGLVNFIKGAVRDPLQFVAGTGLAALGGADKAYNAVTGTAAPTTGVLGQANQVASGFLPGLEGWAKGEGQGALNLLNPATRQQQLYTIADNTYKDPFQALLNASGIGEGVGTGLKAIGGGLDRAAISSVLSPEEAATATITGSNPLTDIGSTIVNGSHAANPLSQGIAAGSRIDDAVGSGVSKLLAKLGGTVSGVDPESLLRRLSNPAETAASAKNVDPYDLVNKVNGAIDATKAARSASYESNQHAFLNAIPQDHPYFGLTDQTPQDIYQPQVLSKIADTLSGNNVGVSGVSSSDQQFLKDYSQRLLSGDTNQVVASGTPLNPDGTYAAQPNNHIDIGLDSADQTRFASLADQMGIKERITPGNGVGFTADASFGRGWGDKGMAKDVLSRLGDTRNPDLNFNEAGYTPAEEATIAKAVKLVSNQNDWSPAGVNALKQKVSKLYRPGDYTNTANPVIQQIKSAVAEPLNQFPEYRDMNAQYAADTQNLDQMRQVVGDSQTMTPQKQIDRISRSMKSANPITQQVVNELEKRSGGQIRNAMAGYLTSSMVPNASLTRTASLGTILHLAAWPAALGLTGASIPRVQGELFGGLGRASQMASHVTVPLTQAAQASTSLSGLLSALGLGQQPPQGPPQ